jgi:hypothetical protein
VAFQPRSPATGGLRPLGLTGRAPLPSFSIGTAGSERVAPPPVLPRRRVGLSQPASRPPAPTAAGSSNWATSVVGARHQQSPFVGFSLFNGGGGISFGGSDSMGLNFFSGAGGMQTGGSSTGIRLGDGSGGGTRTGKSQPSYVYLVHAEQAVVQENAFVCMISK